MSARGRGHPKPHRLRGPVRPQLGVPPRSLTRPGGSSSPPPGGREERAGARSPNTPHATRRRGRQRDPLPPGEGTGNAAELTASIPQTKEHRPSLQALASETPAGGARPTARRRPAAAAAPGPGTAHTGSASGTSGNDPERPRSTEAEARHRAEAARRQPSPTRGGPPTRPSAAQSGRRAGSTRYVKGPRERGRGRVPHPRPSPHRERAGRRGEGPAGRTRRAGPFAMNVRPSPGAALARPGRAQSHHIDRQSGRERPGEQGETRRGPLLGGACYGLAGPTPQGGRPTTRNGERLTRGSEPWKRASSHRPRCPQRGAHGR